MDVGNTQAKTIVDALMPILYIATLIYIQISGAMEWPIIQLILLAIVGELFLLGYWISGRKSLSKKRKKELEKMKAYDI
ncbi:hypothetical protein [Lysinibacillus sphaericus]|uniref:Uncharacterized protein n=1 Tax=Lysinibacillus sphaericus OT4b.31 TaxID=1285586 RepID=R7Z7W5_LYSSH|nr:hypothetical protein [Lysinibacillus sphaericus]EON70198.1 hypothetical protein H131_22696 [Lysinibacillus sphaericus OT4b.31]